MASVCVSSAWTLTPFLYPTLLRVRALRPQSLLQQQRRYDSTATSSQAAATTASSPLPTASPVHDPHLDPPPSDYSRSIFSDNATITIRAGPGGNGCISFFRDAFTPAGPPNGGDGGTGGNVYIRAQRGETSLHKLRRRSDIRAGRGQNGMGSSQGGERGEDVIIDVPVGTVVTEVSRYDPAAEEEMQQLYEDGAPLKEGDDGEGPREEDKGKFLLYPSISTRDMVRAEFPRLKRGRRSALAAAQPLAPISLDLTVPRDRPTLLLAGAVGGLGNPHFVTRTNLWPKIATKGEAPSSVTLKLELKLLADVGLVGLPNAGKSTLLRAMSNARARVGNWAFTTLQPNVGTVVLDTHAGRPSHDDLTWADGVRRDHFTIADIPGLIEGAHLDRGLGISFLRHVERAGVLAFVIDLAAGDAVTALRALWAEVSAYERMKVDEDRARDQVPMPWSPIKPAGSSDGVRDAFGGRVVLSPRDRAPSAPAALSIRRKPWFVVATKADLPATQDNFARLQQYVARLDAAARGQPNKRHNGAGDVDPQGSADVPLPPDAATPSSWTGPVRAIPISAINGHGMERVTRWIVTLLSKHAPVEA